MRTLAQIVGIGLLGGVSLGWPLSAPASVAVSASVQVRARADFDVPLAAHGSWAEIRTYGRCWRPAGVAVSWRPYCDGRWVWTDCGWYWESDEPWAWACYHYGRWVHDWQLGWFWVPDVEWAPAWVYWRVGGGFIGWAPCPPRGVVIGAPLFSFVAVGRFHGRIHPAGVVINDPKIIKQTKEITEIERAHRTIGGVQQKVVINEGPGVAVVQKATGQKIPAVPIQEAVRQSPAPRSEGRETTKPAETTPKSSPPESVQPPNGTPESSGAAPSKDQKAQPGEPSEKDKPPATEPAQPSKGKKQKSDSNWWKGGKGKGKP